MVGTPGNILNKACLFDNDIKVEGQLSAQKIITILVNFGRKMETTLVDIRKLVSRSQAGPSRPPLLLTTPQKEKQVKELKTLLQQRLIKEVIAKVAKIEIPTAVSATTPIAAKAKKTEKDSETKMTSSKPSSQRKSSKKKTKEPSPELEEE